MKKLIAIAFLALAVFVISEKTNAQSIYFCEGVTSDGYATGESSVFNIGSNREVTMNELAQMVRDAAGSTSPITHVPYEQAYAEGFEDMMRRVPSADRLERYIGFKPSTPLERIVEDVVKDQQEIARRKLVAPRAKAAEASISDK